MSDPNPSANAARNSGQVPLSDDALSAELASLASATDSLAPSPAFAEAIQLAVLAAQQTAPANRKVVKLADWRDTVTRRGALVCTAAAAAAALALWWSSTVQNDFDSEVMANFDSVEIIE